MNCCHFSWSCRVEWVEGVATGGAYKSKVAGTGTSVGQPRKGRNFCQLHRHTSTHSHLHLESQRDYKISKWLLTWIQIRLPRMGHLLTCKVACRRSHGTRAPCTPGRPSPPARCRTARMRFVPERPPRPLWKLKRRGETQLWVHCGKIIICGLEQGMRESYSRGRRDLITHS